jgi:pyruvate dehydrogenase E1 component
MFGFQRFGDHAWAAGDMLARGFVLGGTAGRTTLNGEGLQHEDGHSHIQASLIPNCVAYDPAFAHEVAVIIRSGLQRMMHNQEDVFFYITVMNENYAQPGLKSGDEDGILRGMYKLNASKKPAKAHVQLMGSGTILREVLSAQKLLEQDWGVTSDVWSATSFTELRRNGMDVERHNLLHPTEPAQVPYVTQQLKDTQGPIIVSTDYIKAYGDMIRPFIPDGRHFKVLGTDGFGRSDFRSELRKHFEIDQHFIVLAALRSLADEGTIDIAKCAEAIAKYGIDANKANPHHA